MRIDELRARLGEIQTRQTEIHDEHADEALPEESRSEFEALQSEKDETTRLVDELETRAAWVADSAKDEGSTERPSFQSARPSATRGEDIWDLSTVRSNAASPDAMTDELRSRASHAIEKSDYPHPAAEQDNTRSRLERLAKSDSDGSLARRILATGSPTYKRAFAKQLQNRPLSSDETRALSAFGGGGDEGGFAVPFVLDPTVIATSDHSVNPYRAISRVETITNSNTWKGVSSDGVTAGYAAEAAPSTDNAPTLAQPEVTVQKAHAFIPYSFEVGQDWAGIEYALAQMLQEAKDDLEAVQFTTGVGTTVFPEGIQTGATVHVTTIDTAAGVLEVGDLYKIEEALPPRHRARAQFVANRAFYNKVRQLDESGGAALWVRLGQGLGNNVPTPGNISAELIGYPTNECSAFPATFADEDEVLVFGDFSRYLIVDRVGLNVSTIPHLFDPTSGTPTGQSGLYAYWRNSAKVLDANAFRQLSVEST